MQNKSPGEKIKVTEVGPRDGLQNEKGFLSTSVKFRFIQLLLESGIQNIEATSFVKPEAIPQLADSRELSELLNLKDKGFQSQGIHFSCLTPNLRGYQSAIESGFREVAVFTAASEAFTKKNMNKTIRESLEAFGEIFREAKKDQVRVRGYISTIVACPYEGWIQPEKVLELVDRLLDSGAYEISLGETIGRATPDRLERVLEILLKSYPAHLFAGHYHDTFGLALANVQKSLEMGIRSFDSSAGGLGGCPYAKGAAGNLATEDLVYLLEVEGYDTGISLSKLGQASRFMEESLGRDLISKTYQVLKKDPEFSYLKG